MIFPVLMLRDVFNIANYGEGRLSFLKTPCLKHLPLSV